ncbi:amidohydrolase family protein [Georgenia alba]|uniref:Amidohydrolase family protein n=1 Tax=Georgenia alba TaxID=2233858 RepID=A0ABW2Q4G8_9MICO
MTHTVIDTHLHVWDPGLLDYGWIPPGPLFRRFTVADARAAAAELAAPVRGAVLVQAADSLEETRHLLRQQEADEWVLGVVGWLPLRRPDRVRALVEEGFTENLVGVRHLTHDDADPRMLSLPVVRESLAAVAAAGLPLDIPDAYPGQLDQVPDLAADVDGLRVVVDHLAKPPLGGDDAEWEAQLRAAARLPNVVAKVSGLATSVAPGASWGRDLAARAWDLALESFGPDRLMLGSDWPIAPRVGDYAATLGVALELLEELTPAEQAAIREGTARAVYGLPG